MHTKENTVLTSEQRQWMAHGNVLSAIPFKEVGYRGCIGLALLITDTGGDCLFADGDKRLVRDSAIRWASVVDIPHGFFDVETGVRREVQWATIRPTTVKFGTPTIAKGTEEFACDLRYRPVVGKTNVANWAQNRDALDADDIQKCRTFNAIQLAMTSVAFARRSTWQPYRQAFNSLVKKLYDLDVGPKETPFLYGDGVYGDIPHASFWMPKPYISFRADHAESVFYSTTTQSLLGGDRIGYSTQLRVAFTDAVADGLEYKAKYSGTVAAINRRVHNGIPVIAVVLKGDMGETDTIRFHAQTCSLFFRVGSRFAIGAVIGEERTAEILPDNWFDLSLRDGWDFVIQKAFPKIYDDVMALWFARTAVNLIDGYTHFPAPIANISAMHGSFGENLIWDITQPMNYFREDIDACILPPLPIHGWNKLTGVIHDMPFDFHPVDRRYHLDEFRDLVMETSQPT